MKPSRAALEHLERGAHDLATGSGFGTASRSLMNLEAPVLVERDGPLAWLRLNRPDRLNAVSLELYRALTAALGRAGKDRDVRVVILIGTGRAFCVGADLKAHATREAAAQWRARYLRAAQQAALALQTCPKPVVAAVNGHAIGAGLELALSCDLIVLAEQAKLRFPEVALGTFVGGGVTYTLAERIGGTRARELLMLGDFFSPARALEIGFANAVVPAEQVPVHARAMAEQLARNAPVSLSHLKELLHRAPLLDRRTALAQELKALAACMDTRDWAEGVRAFAEKRPPQFVGE
ncbi:MAG TPA: enoyl-CoA hydratase/isomerase family protein [Gemmatimonadales bacterium]|nr:enoyl-CoA hydratase/isomerase family protein [Gemmatimonadales bacterium]